MNHDADLHRLLRRIKVVPLNSPDYCEGATRCSEGSYDDSTRMKKVNSSDPVFRSCQGLVFVRRHNYRTTRTDAATGS